MVGRSRDAAGDLALLRAHEPVACFTRGELFFPTAVGPFVAECSLWASAPGGEPDRLAAAGELTLEGLCEAAAAHSDRALSLRFVQAPLARGEHRRWKRAPRERLDEAVRFTTTGMFGRVVEAGFRASLLARGTVGRGLAAAAAAAYRERLEPERFTYYGRVLRTGGYVCLQYWFFYAMNDWRSSFGGVNDHEADWELVTVYLTDADGAPPRPAWVAFSSHDHEGDELRRRWDDPELHRLGDHPVLYPGAGSHSGAFLPGDYVVSVDPPQLHKPIAALRRVQRLLAPWRDDTRRSGGFGIPFVDYARGDGRAVGPDQPQPWEAVLIDDHTPWVREYRGLWGLDTEDHFGGERAPAGPRYSRDGSVRPAWADPVGWAGLLKVLPDEDHFGVLLGERVAELERDLARRDETIAAKRDELRRTGVQVRSLEGHHHARALAERRRTEMAALEAELDGAIAARALAAEELRAHRATLSRPPAGERQPAHAGRDRDRPAEQQQRRMRFLRAWAALSTPLLLALVPVILLARPLAWITSIAAFGYLFAAVEAFAGRRLLSFVASTLLLVAIAGALFALVTVVPQYWRIVVSVPFAAAALALLAGNVGDLRRGWRRGGVVGDDEP